MDSGSRKLREVENLPLTDTIIAMAISNEQLAVGCLDDSIYVWYEECNVGIMSFLHFPKNLSILGRVQLLVWWT